MRMRLALGVIAAGALALSASGDAEASSHREAPFITRHPKVDNTDFYMFRSYETGRQDYVTIIANYLPLQDAYGGPNYFNLDPDALYEIHIDNTGDAVEDLTFQFRFNNALNNNGTGVTLNIGAAGAKKDVAIPFINANLPTNPPTGPDSITVANQNGVRNVLETFTAKVVTGPRRTGTAADITHTGGPDASTADPKVFVKPVDFIGMKSFGGRKTNDPNADEATGFTNYYTYANQHIYQNVAIPGCAQPAKLFVGQRQEPFAVLLGNVFDLVNATLLQLTDANGGADSTGFPNPLVDKNVTTIALEVHKSCLQPNANEPVIGAWATASLRQARVLNPGATYTRPSREGGAWTQVSRLGMPLVNEVVIGIKDKDKFNASEPKDDAQFADYVTHPTLPAVLEALFGSANAPAPTAFPRTDLVTAFLTGVPGVNKFAANPNPAVAEMLRLNVLTDLGPIKTRAQQVAGGRLGAALCFKAGATANDPKVLDTNNAGCDPHGFPNGRRPGDDVTDIALRVAMGYLLGTAVAGASNAPLGDYVKQLPPAYPDAANPTFPYLGEPVPGSRNY